MLEEFTKYVSNYDLNDSKIRLKYNHCIRVMNLSHKYATILGFSKTDIELATLIGLLHDIGRFEQIKQYDSYDDLKTIDHADYSVEQLFKHNLIEKFWKNEDDYDLIKFAIQNHNKLTIAKTDNERLLEHAKLISDADKLDIFYLAGVLNETKQSASNDKINDNIIRSIFNHRLGSRKDANNINDEIAIGYSFVFDINYDACLKELKDNFKAYYETVGKQEIFQSIIDEINKYIDERMIKC